MGGKSERVTEWAITLLMVPCVFYLMYSNSGWAALILGCWLVWSLPRRWKKLKADSLSYGEPGSRWIPALAAVLFLTLIFIVIYSSMK